MTPGSYKREARRRTAQRVEEKSAGFDPSGLTQGFEDSLVRDCDRLHCNDVIGPCPECPRLKSDPRLVSPPVEGRSQDTTTDESESRGGP